MTRQNNPNHLQAIYQQIEANPGKRPDFIARLFGSLRSEAYRTQPAMDERVNTISP